MIEFKQLLTETDYRKAAGINYDRYKRSAVILILGIIMILMGVFLLFFMTYYTTAFGIFGILYGIIVLLRKTFYKRSIVKNVKSGKNFGREIHVTISEDGMIKTSEGSDESKFDLKNFYGYHIGKIGILLYPQKNFFMILKKESLGEKDFSEILEILKNTGVKKL